MTARQMPKIPEGAFTPEQIEKINGGLDLCSPGEVQQLFANLQQNYETLIDFTSYMFERVGDAIGYTP